jgi:hypothetical protein
VFLELDREVHKIRDGYKSTVLPSEHRPFFKGFVARFWRYSKQTKMKNIFLIQQKDRVFLSCALDLARKLSDLFRQKEDKCILNSG